MRAATDKRVGAGRGRALAVALTACAFVAGCSARKFAYRRAPTFAIAALDEAFGLRTAQKEQLRPRFESLIAWHRGELPSYAALVEDVRQHVGAGIGVEDVRKTRQRALALWERLARQAAPIAADLLGSLDDRQLDRLARQLDKARQERRRHEGTVEDFVAWQARERSRRLENLMGPLGPAQRALLADHLRRNADDVRRRQALDEERLDGLLALARRHPSTAQLEAAVLDLCLNDTGDSTLQARLRGATDDLLVGLLRLGTPAQRRHLDRELVSLRDDLQELARDPR